VRLVHSNRRAALYVGAKSRPLDLVRFERTRATAWTWSRSRAAGYRRREEATAGAIDADGWFETGEMAKVDEDGYLSASAARGSWSSVALTTSYPREIEEILSEQPAVRGAAGVGIPHPELGEDVGAVVAFKAGAGVTEDEIRPVQDERSRLHVLARHVWFVDDCRWLELPTAARRDDGKDRLVNG
jgi:acyl-CoA synthetase (AMP-forming)/AMP-acid ligase II